MPRVLRRAEDAPNDGVKRLREVLRRLSATIVARRIDRTAATVRRWASATRTPDPDSRDKMEQNLGIPSGAWEWKRKVEAD